MAVLSDAKTVSAPFGNDHQLVVVEYDFDNDTGAVADYDVIIADGPILVEYVNCDVEAALTSASDFDIDLGKSAGGAEIWSDNAKAIYAIDLQPVAAAPGLFLELADGEKIVMGIETADATAGKMHMMFKVYKRP